MKEHLRDVEKYIQPGFTRYNWTSLGIQSFSKKALTKLRNVSSRVNQMQDVVESINKKILSLGTVDLFHLMEPDDEIQRMNCKVSICF